MSVSAAVSARLPRVMPRSSHGARERGAMLIIALGVLTLMAILGAAFASLMRLEKRATENYIDSKRMDFLLESALDRVIAQLQGAKNFYGFTIYKNSPWLYKLKTEDDLAHGRGDLSDDRVGQWEVFTERAGQTYGYKTKVIDCSAQINLNGRQDTLARMLDNLGAAIEKSDRLKRDGRKVTNPFYEKPNRSGTRIRGADIVQLRRRLPESRFTSKTQIEQLIGPENYEIVKDFITVSSWEDPNTFQATDGLNEVQDVLGSTTAAPRGVGGGSQGQPQETAFAVSPRLSAEPRHPININTAPEEVLISCLQGLAGRRTFPYSKFGAGGSLGPVDQNATIQGERTIASEELRDVTPRAIFVYSPRLEYEHAKKIAERIIAERKFKPFAAWRTNDPQQPGFEDFIDALDSTFFPSPQNCEVIDPDQPANPQPKSLIIRSGGANEIGRLWIKGHGQGTVRNVRKQKGLSFHEQYAWYYDLIKGVLKANFNPNTRISRYNPNTPAYVPIDKSDLVWAQTRDRLLKGHTTEFCFDTNGIYEITTLGRISTQTQEAPRTVPAGTSLAPAGISQFEKQISTVVKVFDVLRHTTQLDFEKTFVSTGRSSKADRKFVLTWPDPMAALTELYTAGSRRDGRVELAGLLDGQRLQLPINQRNQWFRNFDSLTMAQGFQDRDPTSLARLKRLTTGRSGNNPIELTDALRDVLDANLSKRRSTNRRYLRVAKDLVGPIYKNQDARPKDPLVDTETPTPLGTDLFPDGLNVSLLRMSHLGARVLVLPAHHRIGDTGGDGNSLYGASGLGGRQNIYGNVPYYRGGIAFWVKFEFDGDDPVFSGLIGCTQVIKQVPASLSDYTGSEGTQFFIFKNSKGEMRVVRMYYHQAFLDGAADGGSGGSSSESSVKLYPDPGLPGGASTGPGAPQNPILPQLDPKKIISHSDKVIDVRHFKAHEWHHIAVDWEDENQRYPFRVYIDFQEEKTGGAPRIAQALVDGTANSWVRLNERQPKDGLQIGGIIREQGVSDAGIFKWFTNSGTLASGRGVATVAQSVKKILANATIDEFIAYEGSFPTVKRYYGAAGAPGYFTPQTGEYANVFEVPLPPDVDHVILRSFDWTSYFPTLYTDSRPNSLPQALQVSRPIECELTYLSPLTPPAPFDESWHRPSVPNTVAGRSAYWRTGDLKGHKADVVYKFRLHGARSQQGNTFGGVVQTPVIDDVTLTYFLPNPKILLQEEDEVR